MRRQFPSDPLRGPPPQRVGEDRHRMFGRPNPPQLVREGGAALAADGGGDAWFWAHFCLTFGFPHQGPKARSRWRADTSRDTFLRFRHTGATEGA
jgi:hypothetical protein